MHIEVGRWRTGGGGHGGEALNQLWKVQVHQASDDQKERRYKQRALRHGQLGDQRLQHLQDLCFISAARQTRRCNLLRDRATPLWLNNASQQDEEPAQVLLMVSAACKPEG